MNCQKHLFSLHDDVHYLNNAYKGPLLKTAEEAAMHALQRGRNPSDFNIGHFFDLVDEVKGLYGQIVNCDADQVAVIPSSSYGFASALNNISSKQNGEAITVKDEFPSDFFALKKWCDQHENTLKIISPETEDRNTIAAEWNKSIITSINENTSMVVMSSVHWASGVKFDLQAIGQKCHEMNAFFVVDGAQSVGSQPIDVKACNINVLITAAYKWLLGPYSLGFMYLDDNFYQGTPIEESWMNRTNARDFTSLSVYDPIYSPKAGRYNMGERSNFILMPIAKHGLSQILEWKPSEIQKYAVNLTQPLFEYLKTENTSYSNHLFSLPMPGGINLEKLNENLRKRNIILSQRGESLRVSVNVFNDENDINALIEAIDHSF